MQDELKRRARLSRGSKLVFTVEFRGLEEGQSFQRAPFIRISGFRGADRSGRRLKRQKSFVKVFCNGILGFRRQAKLQDEFYREILRVLQEFWGFQGRMTQVLGFWRNENFS